MTVMKNLIGAEAEINLEGREMIMTGVMTDDETSGRTGGVNNSGKIRETTEGASSSGTSVTGESLMAVITMTDTASATALDAKTLVHL